MLQVEAPHVGVHSKLRFGASASGPCHHSHRTRGSRRLREGRVRGNRRRNFPLIRDAADADETGWLSLTTLDSTLILTMVNLNKEGEFLNLITRSEDGVGHLEAAIEIEGLGRLASLAQATEAVSLELR